MRILFTTTQLAGHYHPLVPIAQAAVRAGHEVAFACAASFVPVVERAGFRAFPAGFDNRGHLVLDLFPGFFQQMAPGRYWGLPNVFVGVYATTMVPDLLLLAHGWPPDLIVRESSEYAGCVVAELLGIPHASVRTSSPSAQYSLRYLLTEALARLRELNGLPPDSDTTMPFRYLHLAPEPPRFRLPGHHAAPTTRLLRPVNYEAGDEALPAWVAGLPARPTVYATLGTELSRSPAGRAVFPLILAALRDEPVNLILTVGRDNDPADFGPQPENVHIARFVPQGLLLPHCDLVVQQGGFSTVTGALNAGLPLVLIPLGADQPYNAACCAALGAGTVIEAGARSAEAIKAAVHDVMDNPSYRRQAERLRDEMATLPGPEHAVELLERLVREQQPILAG